jgi:hypothetical protein
MGLFHLVETASIFIHRVNIRVGANELAQGKRKRARPGPKVCPGTVLL